MWKGSKLSSPLTETVLCSKLLSLRGCLYAMFGMSTLCCCTLPQSIMMNCCHLLHRSEKQCVAAAQEGCPGVSQGERQRSAEAPAGRVSILRLQRRLPPQVIPDLSSHCSISDGVVLRVYKGSSGQRRKSYSEYCASARHTPWLRGRLPWLKTTDLDNTPDVFYLQIAKSKRQT